MRYEDPANDETWYDDGPETDVEAETDPCPDCGGPIYELADRCPACGYWLTADDRRALWSASQKPRWLVLAAWIALAVFVIPLIALVLVVLTRN